MRKGVQIILLWLTLTLLSCGGGNNEEPNDVIPSTERIEVSNVTMLPDAGEKQVTVNANCPWIIAVPESDSWLSINPKSGTNTQTITISCTENATTNNRTSVISISGKQRTTAFTVTQNGREIVAITINNFDTKPPTSSSVEYSFSFSPMSDDIISCGACYCIGDGLPSIDDYKSTGTRSGNNVSGIIESLNTNTKYNVRAFVTNSSGTYYSTSRSITTINNVPGRDDNTTPDTK